MLDGVMIDDAALFNDRLKEWEDFYNYNRPHGGLRWTGALRTTTTEDTEPGVSNHRQWHT